MDARALKLNTGRMDTQATPLAAVTVNEILDRFVRDSLPKRGLRTQRDYLRHIRILRREFGERIADELRPRDFGPFLEVRKGPIQRVRQLAVLSAAFTDAVSRWYMIERNVLRDVKRRKNKPRDRLVLDEEFQGCKAIANPRMQLAMTLAVLTGQRQGDIIGFRWSDVREVTIEGRTFFELHVFQAKTAKRIAIEVTADLEAVLDRCWLLNGGGHAGSEYVLPTRFGRPYTSEGFRACWQRTIAKYCRRGNKRFTFHDLRALAATKCASLEEAQHLLGHSTSAMTRRVYRRGIERVKPLTLSAVQM
ncbi:MAG: tyrosine-type recombinase/integrase [Bryobacteraceae bacterium]